MYGFYVLSFQLPIDKFISNLHLIIDLFTQHSPSTSLVLITPPPISAADRAAQIAPRKLDRDPAVTKAYAEAVIAVGKERAVPVVDLWNGVVDAVEGGEERVGTVMRDGLHLNKAGYQVSYILSGDPGQTVLPDPTGPNGPAVYQLTLFSHPPLFPHRICAKLRFCKIYSSLPSTPTTRC